MSGTRTITGAMAAWAALITAASIGRAWVAVICLCAAPAVLGCGIAVFCALRLRAIAADPAPTEPPTLPQWPARPSPRAAQAAAELEHPTEQAPDEQCPEAAAYDAFVDLMRNAGAGDLEDVAE